MTVRQHRNTVVKYTLDPSVAARVVALMWAGPRKLVPTRVPKLFACCILHFAACMLSISNGLRLQMPIVKGDGHLGKAAIYDWEREVCRAMVADSRGGMCSPAPISFVPSSF